MKAEIQLPSELVSLIADRVIEKIRPLPKVFETKKIVKGFKRSSGTVQAQCFKMVLNIKWL